MRLALVTTPPSVRSEIGDTTRHLLAHLREHLDVTVFVEDRRAGEDCAGLEARAASSLMPREFDQILFQLGNEAVHGFMAPMVRALGGVVCLHDWGLFDLACAAWPDLTRKGWRGQWLALREGGTAALGRYRAGLPSAALASECSDLALNHSIVRFADGFFVHSDALGHRIIEERNAPTPIGVLPPGVEARWSDTPRRAVREQLAPPGWVPAEWERAFVITSSGAVREHNRIEVLLETLARARADGRDLRLVLIGSVERELYDPRPALQRLGLTHVVHTTGHVPEQQAREWIRAGDLAVELCGPSQGGTPGPILQSLAHGRGVMASRTAERGELPSSCVLQVERGQHEVRDLARLLCELAADPDRRAQLERSAREFVRDECCWERVAERYAEALELMPRPRSAKRRFLFDRIRQGVQQSGGGAAGPTPERDSARH